jgi:hypothetical protein
VAAMSIASGSPTMEAPNLKIEEKVVVTILIKLGGKRNDRFLEFPFHIQERYHKKQNVFSII